MEVIFICMVNLDVQINIKQLQIKGESDTKRKQVLYNELRILEYRKEIEDIRKRISKLVKQKALLRKSS